MVVSAILLTALAPITGALFGASYGTAIRIGYEIIFPALFGDMVNDAKKTTVSQEEGAKRTIKALHTMFQATGGASALEFGINQGIEMAKKKTESLEVQHLISLNLGITEAQVRARGGRGGGVGDTAADEFDSSKTSGFTPQETDFQSMSVAQIQTYFETVPQKRSDALDALNLLIKQLGVKHIFVAQMRNIINIRFPITTPDTASDAIDKSGATGIVKQIAILYNVAKQHLDSYWKWNNNQKSRTAPAVQKALWASLAQKEMKLFLKAGSAYNIYVARNRKSNLQIDTAKSLANGRMTPK